MNITTSIKAVQDKPRSWKSGQGGEFFAVSGRFTDDTIFEINFKTPEKAEEHIKLFTGMIGKEGEFEVEDTGREYRGSKQYKLKNWPGKPQQQGGFGGRGPMPVRYRDTPEGVHEERLSIARSVALQQAVAVQAHIKEPTWAYIKGMADNFYAWLIETQPKPQTQPQDTVKNLAATTPSTTTADKLPPPTTSPAYKKALDKITAAIRERNVDEVARIMNVAEQAFAEKKLTENERNGITNECTTALKKIKALEKEPVAA